MITQVDVQLETQQEVKTQQQSYTGYLIRGLIYSALRAIDPRYAERLHSEKGLLAPVSVKPPHTLAHGKIKIYLQKVPANTTFSVQITALDQQLAELLCKALINQQENIIELAQAKAKIISLAVKQVDLKRLQQNNLNDRKFAIRFLTPTFFRVRIPKTIRSTERVRVLPLPDPIRMFTNLCNIWNVYLKPRIKKDYLEWLQQYPILISRLKDIKTHRYYEHPVKGVFAVGFTGIAYYALAEDAYDKYMARTTCQLLKLAEYSNVGGNRTAGFGWVEIRYPRG